MEVIRRIERVAGSKLTLDLPASLQGKQVEVIVLELPSEKQIPDMTPHRLPPTALAGKMTLRDDLIAPAVPETDWDAR